MAEKEKPVAIDLFLREKPARMVVGLKTSKNSVYVTLLAKEADCTYSHTVKILNVLKDLGIVKFQKKGRIKKVTLTEEGWDIAQKMETMIKKLLHLDKNLKKPKKKK